MVPVFSKASLVIYIHLSGSTSGLSGNDDLMKKKKAVDISILDTHTNFLD